MLIVGRLFGWVRGGFFAGKYSKVIQERVVFFQLFFVGGSLVSGKIGTGK